MIARIAMGSFPARQRIRVVIGGPLGGTILPPRR